MVPDIFFPEIQVPVKIFTPIYRYLSPNNFGFLINESRQKLIFSLKYQKYAEKTTKIINLMIYYSETIHEVLEQSSPLIIPIYTMGQAFEKRSVTFQPLSKYQMIRLIILSLIFNIQEISKYDLKPSYATLSLKFKIASWKIPKISKF